MRAPMSIPPPAVPAIEDLDLLAAIEVRLRGGRGRRQRKGKRGRERKSAIGADRWQGILSGIIRQSLASRQDSALVSSPTSLRMRATAASRAGEDAARERGRHIGARPAPSRSARARSRRNRRPPSTCSAIRRSCASMSPSLMRVRGAVDPQLVDRRCRDAARVRLTRRGCRATIGIARLAVQTSRMRRRARPLRPSWPLRCAAPAP